MTADIVCFEMWRTQLRAETQQAPAPPPKPTLTHKDQKRRHAQRMYEHLGRTALAASVDLECGS